MNAYLLPNPGAMRRGAHEQRPLEVDIDALEPTGS